MSAVATAIAGSAIIGAAASNKASKRASSSADAATAVEYEKLDLARDQWDYYKEKFEPILDDLTADTKEGYKPDYEGVTARASSDVMRAFAKARQMSERNVARLGINPNSGAFVGNNRLMALEQAKTEAGAMNQAREGERRYADETNFNRKLNVASIGQGLPATAAQGMSSAANGLTNIANMQAQSAQQTARGATNLANQFFQAGINGGFGLPSSAPATVYQPNTATAQGVSVADWDGTVGVQKFEHGGPIDLEQQPDGSYGLPASGRGGMVQGGNGEVDSVPAAIVGRDGRVQPALLTEDEYVIPKDVVRRKGTDFFDKMIEQDHEPRGLPRQ